MLAKGQQPRKLNPRMKTEENMDNGFVVEGDERWFRNYNYSSIERTVNVSCSFSYDGGCVTCLSGRHDAWGGKGGEPVVIVATDHHFPPNIPVDGEGECIRVLRVEFGSLNEIAKELSRMKPDGGTVPGTVVLYGSVSAMEVESAERAMQGNGNREEMPSRGVWGMSWSSPSSPSSQSRPPASGTGRP
jgi:hypothetical protein